MQMEIVVWNPVPPAPSNNRMPVLIVITYVVPVQQLPQIVHLVTTQQLIPISIRPAMMELVWLDVPSTTTQIQINCLFFVLVVCLHAAHVRMM